MEVIRNSVVGQALLPLWHLLFTYYNDSFLAVCFRTVARSWKRAWRNSVLVRFCSREGALSRGWKPSVTCRGLTLLFNLPGTILHWIYQKLQPVFDSSGFARLGFGLVEETPAAVGWLMLAILVIPYDNWNNAYSLMGFALLGAFAIAAGMRKGSPLLDVRSVGPYGVAFAAFVLLAWPLSAYVHLSGRFVYYHLAGMLCVIIVVSTVERASQLMRLLGMSTLGLLAMSLYGIYQRIQGIEVNPSYVDLTLNEGMPGRVFSFYNNPNAFGEVLLLLIPLAVALMIGSRSWLGRFGGLAGAGLGCVALVMTYCRAGWIGLMCAAFLFVFLWNRKLLPAFLLLGLACIPFLPDTVFNRILTIFNFSDSSTSSRFPLYQAALRLLETRPVSGAGLGIDAVRTAVKDLNLYHGASPFVHSHDVYLQIWAETGILGLLSFLGTMGWTLKKAVRAVWNGKGDRRIRLTVIGGASSMLGILVCGIADFIWHYPRVMLIFWFVFAVTLAGVRLAFREEKRAAARRIPKS